MLKAVFLAIRPKTLSISLSPVLIGSAIAMERGNFDFGIFILIAIAALSIQITANLSNDLFDGIAGVDSEDRLGPTRVTAAGLLSVEAVAVLTAFSIILAAAAGLILVLKGGTVILLIGSSAIISALLYTAGPYSLGKLGLGELFVFFYFGPVAVLGSAYLHGGEAFSTAALLLFILGFFSRLPSVCGLSGIALIPFLIRQHRLYSQCAGRCLNRLLEELSFSILAAGLLFFLLCLF